MHSCEWCGIIGRPFSTIIPTLCDECADWTVFEAMLNAWWYVNEASALTAYKMHLCRWYEALGDDGVPLGYLKAHDRWYAPYGTIQYESLTPSQPSATLLKSQPKPSSDTTAPVWGCEDII